MFTILVFPPWVSFVGLCSFFLCYLEDMALIRTVFIPPRRREKNGDEGHHPSLVEMAHTISMHISLTKH